MYRLLQQAVSPHFLLVFHMNINVNRVIFLNSVNKLIFVMVKCGVLFLVQTELLGLFRQISTFERFVETPTTDFVDVRKEDLQTKHLGCQYRRAGPLDYAFILRYYCKARHVLIIEHARNVIIL
jgi:hypothetical protein